eukprot:CAMPEP_0202809994 /NCGR_PEP_ID=MMETSP1389-20130828/2202_1 /ASSEMBLY_ACC=CAM_ASM_000865 /TAXON_ID=302021 /ORGANISM="Rhodomonas sp., Strain CCMP768" /LENGTH=198 /DNA_ID=CAMNT_0049480763 /DNA_START=117 /DNA_END=714 /DNA_ORIENTATION=-
MVAVLSPVVFGAAQPGLSTARRSETHVEGPDKGWVLCSAEDTVVCGEARERRVTRLFDKLVVAAFCDVLSQSVPDEHDADHQNRLSFREEAHGPKPKLFLKKRPRHDHCAPNRHQGPPDLELPFHFALHWNVKLWKRRDEIHGADCGKYDDAPRSWIVKPPMQDPHIYWNVFASTKAKCVRAFLGCLKRCAAATSLQM